MERAFQLLRRIGMLSTYSGYNYLACAITLVLDNPDYLRNVTKTLYNVIGEKYGVTGFCVEAALRTLITNYWNLNSDKILKSVIGFPLFDKPTASELISILADYLRDQQ